MAPFVGATGTRTRDLVRYKDVVPSAFATKYHILRGWLDQFSPDRAQLVKGAIFARNDLNKFLLAISVTFDALPNASAVPAFENGELNTCYHANYQCVTIYIYQFLRFSIHRAPGLNHRILSGILDFIL